MSKPTITEFLEARIAEDERQFELPDFVDEEGARGPGWGNRGECPICGAYQYSGTESGTKDAWWDHAESVHQRRKALAECAAKRAIIDLADEALADEVERHDASALGARLMHGDALCHLAAVYSSHPDYDPSWAPNA